MKRSLFAVLSVIFILAVAACGNRPYMTVNGKVITVSEFNKAVEDILPPEEERFPGIEEQAKSMVESQFIRETVVEQLQQEYQIQLEDEEIDQIYNYFVLSARRYPTLEIAEELFPYYERKTKEEVRQMTADALLQNKLIETIYADTYQKPTEDQVRSWYDERKEDFFTVPKCYYVSQLFVTKPVEEEVTEEVIEGEITEENADGTEETVGVVEGVEETVEEVVEETAAEKLLKELEADIAKIDSEKAFMKTAAKYMKDNPYFDRKDYKANRGFVYITENTKDVDDLLKDVPNGGVSAVYDYSDYNAYIVFYVYSMIPEHTIELDQIRAFAEIETGFQLNQEAVRQFNEKIAAADVVYNEADRLAAEEEIILEEEEIVLPPEDSPVVDDGIDDSVMETDDAGTGEAPAAETVAE